MTVNLAGLGGRLAFVDCETGLAIPQESPRMFVHNFQSNKPPRWNLTWLIGHCCTLVSNQPLSIQQKLFTERQIQHWNTKEQFREGRTYSLEVERPWSAKKSMEGTRAGHFFWRAMTGYWLAEPDWETQEIPSIQRRSESFTVGRT